MKLHNYHQGIPHNLRDRIIKIIEAVKSIRSIPILDHHNQRAVGVLYNNPEKILQVVCSSVQVPEFSSEDYSTSRPAFSDLKYQENVRKLTEVLDRLSNTELFELSSDAVMLCAHFDYCYR